MNIDCKRWSVFLDDFAESGKIVYVIKVSVFGKFPLNNQTFP